MARVKKNFEKEVRKVKGKGAAAKKKAIHAMLEALINEDAESAAIHFHSYMQMKSRDIILGEAEDEDEKSEKSEDDEDEDDEDEKEEKKEKEEEEEVSDDEDDDEEDDEKEDDEDKDDKKKVTEAAKRPSAGLTKRQRSNVVKSAKAGKDLGGKGKDFKKVEKAAAKQYGSKEAGEKVAAARMWEKEAKKRG